MQSSSESGIFDDIMITARLVKNRFQIWILHI